MGLKLASGRLLIRKGTNSTLGTDKKELELNAKMALTAQLPAEEPVRGTGESLNGCIRTKDFQMVEPGSINPSNNETGRRNLGWKNN